MREFTVAGETKSVDDTMLGIPLMFRDEFVGANFDSYRDLCLCLTHADVAKRAKFKGCPHIYEYELKAMKVYLR
jgi:hypothetical protein